MKPRNVVWPIGSRRVFGTHLTPFTPVLRAVHSWPDYPGYQVWTVLNACPRTYSYPLVIGSALTHVNARCERGQLLVYKDILHYSCIIQSSVYRCSFLNQRKASLTSQEQKISAIISPQHFTLNRTSSSIRLFPFSTDSVSMSVLISKI